MLSTLFFYILITGTCLWTGYFFCYFISKKAGGEADEKNGVVLAIWGMILMSGAAQVAELFIPVHQTGWLAWVLLLIVVSVFNKRVWLLFTEQLRRSFHRNKHLLLPVCVTGLLISVLGAGPLMMDDTESYHIQCIKWIQEWGTVPGLANLHERYGFNSGWFAFAALFTPQHTVYNYYTLANGVFSVWISVYLLQAAFPGRQEAGRAGSLPLACFAVLITALFCWPMIRGNAATANYDFITTGLVIVGLVELIRLTQTGRYWKSLLPEGVVWPFFLFTVRIINFPLLLFSLPALVYLIRGKSYRLLIPCLLLAAGLVLPFLLRNVLLSGFLFFPAYQIDLFSVDWKADPALTKELVHYIKYFNRINNIFLPIRKTAQLRFADWFPLWFRYLSFADKLVLAGGLAGYGRWVMRQKGWGRPVPALQFFAGVMLLQLFSWFLVAPDPRFVYGPLLAGIFLLFYSNSGSRLQAYYLKRQMLLQNSLLLVLLAYTLVKFALSKDYHQPLQPIPIPVPVTRIVWVDSIRLQIPQKIGTNWNARCYATGLPCLYKLDPRLRARGKSIRAGFTIRKRLR